MRRCAESGKAGEREQTGHLVAHHEEELGEIERAPTVHVHLPFGMGNDHPPSAVLPF